MRAVITVFKTELINKPAVLNSIQQLSSHLSEVGEAYSFSPKPGRLYELLNFLKDHDINYGTHFNVTDEQ